MRFTLFLIFVFPNLSFGQWGMWKVGEWSRSGISKLGDQSYNDIWGYTDVKGKEYAILGSLDSIYFLEITQSPNIKLCGVLAGKSRGAINRDVEVYEHYAYCVADEGAASLQIVDLQYLPDSIHLVSDHQAISQNAHTVHVSGSRLYICKNKRQGRLRAMDIYSLKDPEKPEWIGELIPPSDGGGGQLFDFVHEVHVKNDTAYCACGNGGLFIYDVRNPASPKLLTSQSTYPEKGFCHAAAVMGQTLVVTDENPGLGVKAFTYQNNILQWKTTFRTHSGAVAHSPFCKGKYVYLSAYQDGVYIYNLEDPSNPFTVAWYDTYPDNASGQYDGLKGCWGVYPYLPSGRILASDMKYGLFVFEMAENLGINNGLNKHPQSQLLLTGQTIRAVSRQFYQIYNLNGQLLYSQNMEAGDEIKNTSDILWIVVRY